MEPVGFSKTSYSTRGMILAIALITTAAYWYDWYRGMGALWRPFLGMMVIGILVFSAAYKRYLLLYAFGTISALGFLGTVRAFLTGDPLLPGLTALGIALFVFILLGGHRRDTNWLFNRNTLGDEGEFVKLNLSVPHSEKGKRAGGRNPV
jgi:hypothetical protein